MSAGADTEVHMVVPESLKRLVRYIIHGFYSPEHGLVMGLLLRHPCIKDDDLLQLLQFERRQLRAVISSLKTEKMIKVTMRMETDAEGKPARHNYYFINYSVFVNVVKYKLDHMRRKIETEERESTSRASFKCPQCLKTFTDLEADQLFDFSAQKFLCTYCREEVEEEASAQPKTDARTLMVQFNDQIAPIFSLLREVEDIKLAPELLKPEPVDIKAVRPQGGGNRGPGDRNVWSGDATRNAGYGFTEQQVTISMEGEGDRPAAEKLKPKEAPIWMVESTVEGASSETIGKRGESPVIPGPSRDMQAASTQDNNDIMRTLLAHEKKISVPASLPARVSEGADSSTSESEDDMPKMVTSAADTVQEMESDDEEDSSPMVMIGQMRVPFAEVTEDMVEKMTAAEKELYIKIGQDMYSDMYD